MFTYTLRRLMFAVPTLLVISLIIFLVSRFVMTYLLGIFRPALLLLIMNLTGMGIGPTFVGFVSDALRASHPGNSLQLAFLCLVPVYGVAIGLFVWLARVLRKEGSVSA